MKDQIRARRLAVAAAILIIVLLYALGGLSLYLRAHLLPDTASLEAAATPPGALPGGDALPTVLAQEGFPSTLVPTITPRPGP